MPRPRLIADDKDKSGKLQFPEFLSLARALIGTRKVRSKQTAARGQGAGGRR